MKRNRRDVKRELNSRRYRGASGSTGKISVCWPIERRKRRRRYLPTPGNPVIDMSADFSFPGKIDPTGFRMFNPTNPRANSVSLYHRDGACANPGRGRASEKSWKIRTARTAETSATRGTLSVGESRWFNLSLRGREGTTSGAKSRGN